MTKKQYRATLDKLGLSQARAADFLGISHRASQGYALGEQPVPVQTAKLLTLMVEKQLTVERVNKITARGVK